MKPHPLRSQVVKLRKTGATIAEISSALKINKSTVHYIVQSVVLTEQQKELLDKKRLATRRKAALKLNARSPADRVAGSRKGGVNNWKKNSHRLLSNLRGGNSAANLTYRKDELVVKSVLDKKYRCSFQKECINGRYVDFASKRLLIEHTTDSTHGTYDLVRRFMDITADKRRKIAYLDLPKLGPLNRQRLAALSVELHDYRELVE
jgi:hypothetical protein